MIPSARGAAERRWERWGAASGFAALAAGAVGGALERGWPDAAHPGPVTAFVLEHRPAILGQSMAFLLSSACYLWFLGSVRAFLARHERGSDRLSSVAFGAGVAWVVLGMVAQAFQVGQTMAVAAGAPAEPALLWTMAAAFAIANLPCAVMLLAIAVVTFRDRAFPAWLGTISVAAAAAELLLWSGAAVATGPLAPNGWLTYALYPLLLVWLVPTAVVMMRRSATAER